MNANFLDQMERIGTCNDVVKTLYRVLAKRGLSVPVTKDNVFEPNRMGATTVTGVVIAFGKMDDTRANWFMVIEALDSRIFQASIADDRPSRRWGTGRPLLSRHMQKALGKSIIPLLRPQDAMAEYIAKSTMSPRSNEFRWPA